MNPKLSQKRKRGEVVQSLRAAFKHLNDAHKVCFEELYPTWQTVEQDIEVIRGGLKSIIEDLCTRDIEEPKDVVAEAEPNNLECKWCGSLNISENEVSGLHGDSTEKTYFCAECGQVFSLQS
jgi:hypothetical protein